MNQTQASRLLTLAWFLKTEVPACQFDLNYFVNTTPKKIGECGTTACALGWCPTVFPGQWEWYAGVAPRPLRETVTEFFGIDPKDWSRLFSSRHTRTPKQEARVIEQLVAKHGYTYAEAVQ